MDIKKTKVKINFLKVLNFLNFLKVLNFLRITDEQNRLSITNLLLIAISVKLIMLPELDAVVMTGFIMSLIQYAHKRHINTEDRKK